MEGGAVCIQCHAENKLAITGATIAGTNKARLLRSDIEKLKERIERAEKTLTKAEQLGMEVSQPRFDLRQAQNSLTNVRSLVHTFAAPPGEANAPPGERLAALEKALDEAKQKKDKKLENALVTIPVQYIWLSAAEQCRGTSKKASWLLSPFTALLTKCTGGCPGSPPVPALSRM
jgi:hypothetical protein